MMARLIIFKVSPCGVARRISTASVTLVVFIVLLETFAAVCRGYHMAVSPMWCWGLCGARALVVLAATW